MTQKWLLLAALLTCSIGGAFCGKLTSPLEEISVNTVCSVHRLDVCGRNQACVEEEEDGGGSGQGLCKCLSGFATQDDGVSDR